MRILFLHCRYKWKGGEDRVVEDEMRLLQKEGHTVGVLLFDNGRQTLLNVLQMPFNIGAYLRTRKAIRRFRPDIVHVHNFHFAASPSVYRAIHSMRIPFVQTLHNYRLLCPSATLFHEGKLFTSSLDERFPWTAVRKAVYQRSSLLTFWLAFTMKVHRFSGTWRLCARYIVLTAHARSVFTGVRGGFPAMQLAVKPNFAEIMYEQAAEENYFLFAGRLTEEKGIETVLCAFAKNGLPLLVAGEGPLAGKVKAFARQYPNIRYAGALDRDDLLAKMRSATALLFPSTWWEGMPLTIIEAFACGTPVIASRLGAMTEMIVHGHNGFHVTPGDADALGALTLDWSLLPQHARAAFRKQALATYRSLYTPAIHIEKVLAIYAAAGATNVAPASALPVTQLPVA